MPFAGAAGQQVAAVWLAVSASSALPTCVEPVAVRLPVEGAAAAAAAVGAAAAAAVVVAAAAAVDDDHDFL